MNLALRDIHVGAIDGKNEFLETTRVSPALFSELFTLPPKINLKSLTSRRKYFLVGLRGTGKTSFLRWYATHHRRDDAVSRFVLFKSHIDESKRVELSNQAGAYWAEISPDKFEYAQDFKEAWKFFLHYQIGSLIAEKPECHDVADSKVDRYLNILGLGPNGAAFERILGYFPRLSGAKIKIDLSFPGIKAELSGDIVKSNKVDTVTIEALNRALDKLLYSVKFSKNVLLCLDELEVFNIDASSYQRDLRMVRDLIFAIDSINSKSKENSTDLHVIAAMRTEVVDAIGPVGQEVNRIVDDFSIRISWYGERNIEHPLFEMVRKRLKTSEHYAGIAATSSEDILLRYFPKRVGAVSLEEYLLDGSFYKPRDVVARMQAVQDDFPESTVFSESHLKDCYKSYSRSMWKEIELELSAYFSQEELALVQRTFAGKKGFFEISDYRERIAAISKNSVEAQKFFGRKGPDDLIADLYKLGVVGNEFFVDVGRRRRKRNRWVYRGDPTVILDDTIVVNRALWGALSIAS